MFESIRLDDELAAQYGLEPTTLDRLGDIVAITGPNGAGKTRLLNLISDQLGMLRKEFERLSEIARAEVGKLPEGGGDLNTVLHYATAGMDNDSEREAVGIAIVLFALFLRAGGKPPEGFEDNETVQAIRERYTKNVKTTIERFGDTIRFRGGLQTALHRGSWPKVVSLSASTGARTRYDDRSPLQIRLNEFPHMALELAAKVGFLQRHPEWQPSDAEDVERAAGFKRTVSALLGMQFGEAFEGITIFPTLDGRVIQEEELSAGQRLLIRWAQIIYESVSDIEQAILLIDEPELHLHPAALVDVIQRLRALKPAQIWVATHSVPLLALLGPRRIIHMERNRASPATGRIEHALDGLLGGPEGIGRLRTFLGDASAAAFHQFAAESLVSPTTVGLRPGDKQAHEFSGRIGRLLDEGREVRVLEYAAGRGRLVHALAIALDARREHLRYHVVNDPAYTTEEDREACVLQLTGLHGRSDVDDLYWTHLREFQRPTTDKMHAVVLCNVLHEIPPNSWPDLLASLRRCLLEDGHLLILEDQEMTTGELPHARGFLVLDDVELRALFGLSSAEAAELRYSLVHSGRLSFAEVPARLLDRCNGTTVRQALELLRDRALEQVGRLRSGSQDPEPLHRRGRRHAFFSLLHTNATLALRSVG